MNPPKEKRRRIVVGVTKEGWGAARILESGKFDRDYYCRTIGTELSEAEAVEHYVTEGEKQGFSPSADFDVGFYAAVNSDVDGGEINLFAHFLTRGIGEGRYGNLAALKADAQEVSRRLDGQLRLAALLKTPGDALGLTEIEAHLAYKWRDGKKLIERFDDLVYYALYNYARDFGMPPLLHYLRIGNNLNYFINEAELAVHRKAIRDDFDEDYYVSQGRLNDTVSALDEFCSIGWRLGRNPSPDFEVKYYLDMYHDISKSYLSPFYHYVVSGKKEGRVAKINYENIIAAGRRKFDPSLRTIIVASHEASRTGAPLLALDIGRKMMLNHNIIYILVKGGELAEDFAETGTFVATDVSFVQLRYLLNFLDANFDIPFILANSVETVEVAEAALMSKIPVVGLVHEFSEYTLPPGKIGRMVMAADIVVTPAELISASVQTEIERVYQYPSNNLRVRQQGKLEGLGALAGNSGALSIEDIREIVGAPAGSNVKIVLGAGHVQTRKGVDIFVQTAREAVKKFGEDIRFVWVGAGYRPDADVVSSVWIRATIERLGLSKYVHFLPNQPDLDNLYEVSDLFFLSSRLDPFPNVAVDALAAGRKIVCFSQGTGIAEWIEDGRLEGAAVEYGSVTDAADAIGQLLKTDSLSEKNLAAGAQYFRMEDYVQDLVSFGNEAAALRAQIIEDEQVVRASGMFDPVFFSANPAAAPKLDEHIRMYSVWSQKGAVAWNPRPGFNEGAYRARNGLLGQPGSMLAHAVEAKPGIAATTHVCHDLDALKAVPSSLRVAIHLHLHYADLAPEFAKRFGEVTPRADLFITVTSDKGRREVEYAFRNHKTKVVVLVAENRGRDIAPMLAVLDGHAGDYDLFGHFHGKKSLFAGGTLGADWRSFLLDTLVGTAESTSKLMTLFQADPTLGLAFAEDRMNAGWTKNYELGVAMAEKLGLPADLDPYPIFPIGTMFWVRPSALAPLINARMSAKDFPPEPLPDDKTSLHAIERLIPTIVQSSGFSWCTVRRKEVNRGA